MKVEGNYFFSSNSQKHNKKGKKRKKKGKKGEKREKKEKIRIDISDFRDSEAVEPTFSMQM